MSVLSAPHFHNEQAAYAYVEARVWPEGPVCPHCGGYERIGKMGGKSTRIGAYKCYQCRKPFTVKVGTIFESSHVPLRHWLQAMFLMASSKKGISANQLHRTLGCTLKTAWFLAHRIREAMKDGGGMIGGEGKTVEADETYVTKSVKTRRQPHERTTTQILALVERDGPIRSMFLDHKSIQGALYEHLDRACQLVTDGSMSYRKFMPAGQHEWVDHNKGEYVRGEVHTNTLEGFFSIFKRGLVGTYQHMDKRHLGRYLAEFDFRYNNRIARGVSDVMRADILLAGVVGKRLTYRTTGAQA